MEDGTSLFFLVKVHTLLRIYDDLIWRALIQISPLNSVSLQPATCWISLLSILNIYSSLAFSPPVWRPPVASWTVPPNSFHAGKQFSWTSTVFTFVGTLNSTIVEPSRHSPSPCPLPSSFLNHPWISYYPSPSRHALLEPFLNSVPGVPGGGFLISLNSIPSFTPSLPYFKHFKNTKAFRIKSKNIKQPPLSDLCLLVQSHLSEEPHSQSWVPGELNNVYFLKPVLLPPTPTSASFTEVWVTFVPTVPCSRTPHTICFARKGPHWQQGI